LLTTKVQMPPLPSKTVLRRHLYQALDRGLGAHVRVTLISAPAGYGKTTLLSAWARDRDLPTAWLSISEDDNDPARFVAYLLAALRAAEVDVDEPEGDWPFPAEGPQSAFLIPAINQIDHLEGQWVLVLDDYHLIRNQSVHDHVSFLMENLPPHAHLYIGTRADPPLPIARLRGRGQVNELRMQDLRFREKETESFLNALFGLGLGPDDVQTLQRRTEGWISGLQMVAASLRNQANPSTFIRDFSGAHHHIMDYLVDEVLRREPQVLQTFLLETSILERLCAPLCDAVRQVSGEDGSSIQELLRRLESDNLFIVPLDERREWYRYHRLFSDLLRMRLKAKDPRRIPLLHRRASQWLEEKGIIEAAVHHALRCGDDDFAGDMVERYAQQMLLRSETVTFLDWVRNLPAAQIRTRPRLAIYRAWSLLLQGAPLSVVESGIDDSRREHGPPGSSQSLEAFIRLSQGQLQDGLRLAEQALERLPPDEIYMRNFATICAAGAKITLGEVPEGLRLLNQAAQSTRRAGNRVATVLMLCELAELRMKALELDAAEELYSRALEIGTSDEGLHLPIAGRALIGQGSIALERGELESAEQYLLDGVELASRWSLISTLDGHFSLAMLYDLLGAEGRLRETLTTLADLSRRFDASEFDDIIVMMLQARVDLRRGDLQAVRKWAADRDLVHAPVQKPARYHQNSMQARLYKYELPVIARWWVAEGQLEQALTAVEELIALAEVSHRPFLLVEAEILRAKIHDQMGARDAAIRALGRALAVSVPQGSRRMFLAEADGICKLLKQIRSERDNSQVCAFVDDLIVRMASPLADAPPSSTRELPEALTPRELDVLRLLPSGLNAGEIANELVISVNTVRSHLKNIYAKLEVHSRHEAVVKASELDLI
jgi:LuxR family maltose regulon positive regulatory protein